MKKIVILALLAGFFSACVKQAPKGDLHMITDKIIGSWENRTDSVFSAEFWEKRNDSLYAGKGFVLVNADTVFYEDLQLSFKNGNVYYIPTVRDQNNAEPVSFKAGFLSGDSMVFENPGHDFPQRIVYIFPDSMRMNVYVAGKTEKGYRKEDFEFTKVVE